MKLISVNIGRPKIIMLQGTSRSSAINKTPTTESVEVTSLNLVGDKQADTKHHGGESMAVCCYPIEHYPAVEDFLGTSLSPPSFGENLTTQGLIEKQLYIGDRFRVGTVVLEITKPREPCSVLARRHNNLNLVKWIHETRCTGFYCRVIEPGHLQVEENIEIISHASVGDRISMDESMTAMFGDVSRKILERCAASKTICPRWQKRFEEKIQLLEKS